MNTLIIEKYNPRWAAFFERESRKIKSIMGENAIEIHHVGSTSVPDLAAKPIVDMILVTEDLESTRKFLTSHALGYRYKGEYNLPLRDLYGKKDEFDVYLHVHRVNSPEIELNLLFRDYLRSNEKARNQYKSVKIAAANANGASKKVGTGITKYNLLKNDFIVSVLKETGFSGICARFVTQKAESEFFNKIKNRFLKAKSVSFDKIKNKNFGDFCGVNNLPFSEQHFKKIVLYEGVNLVGGAELLLVDSYRVLINFVWTNDDEKLLRKLLSIIEDWVKIRAKTKFL